MADHVDDGAAMRRLRFVPLLLIALSAFAPLSTDLYLPSLPAIGAAFGVEQTAVQLTLSVFLVGFAGGQLVYGPLSDRYGRRPALVGGLGLFILGSLFCAFAPSLETLVAARFVQALGAGCGPVIAVAVVRDLYEREAAARLMAHVATATSLAPALGPMLGGALQDAFGWRANFAALTLFGASATTLVLTTLAETNRLKNPEATRPRQVVANYLGLLRHRVFLAYVLVAAFGYGGIFAFISGSSFVFQERLGLTPQEFGFSFAVMVVGYLAGTIGAGRLMARLGVDRLIGLGTAIASVGGLAMFALSFLQLGGAAGVAAILAPVWLFSFGIGFVQPGARASAVSPFPHMAGAAKRTA